MVGRAATNPEPKLANVPSLPAFERLAPPASAAEFKLFAGAAEACRALHAAGYVLVVATNQPDVGRGTRSRAAVEAIHAKMCELLPIDRVEVCYHPGQGASECDCRKPKPGMLLRAAREGLPSKTMRPDAMPMMRVQ